MSEGLRYFMANSDPLTDRFYQDQGFKRVHILKEADFINFNGGSDVFPLMYNQMPIESRVSQYDVPRDMAEYDLFKEAQDLELLQVGICRGGQFLHIMNGGTLWQDVNNHQSSHAAVFQTESGELTIEKVTSTHHQMMRPDSNQEFVILAAAAGVATQKFSYDMKHKTTFMVQGDILDIEALWYPNTKSFCFQPHPEYHTATKDMQDWFLDVIRECV